MPASMITAWVALSPNVTGSRIEMPDSGPMPGSTPTSVPTRQPRNAYQRLSNWNAIANPFSRLCRVVSTLCLLWLEHDPVGKPGTTFLDHALISKWPGDERRLEHVDEGQVGDADNSDAVEHRIEQRPPLDRDQQHEHHRRHG